MKHFVTLFPPAQNVHLVKDVGQIPYHMQKQFGYKSTLVCYKNSSEYSYLKTEVAGLNLKFIKDTGSLFFLEKAVVRYLRRHASTIDVLNLYHLTQSSMLYGLIYKTLNPGGMLYLKMDMDITKYKQGIQFSDNSIKNWLHVETYKRFLNNVDLVTVETNRALALLQRLDERLYAKCKKLSNGVDLQRIQQKIDGSLHTAKQNVILNVGRIGIEAKNNAFLLKALAKIDLTGWKVFFVGPVANDFKPVIESFYNEHPALKEKVFFTGEIKDRDKLMHYYMKAKIFCLTSRWESFATVLPEALGAGNYIIGTDSISSIEEIIDDEKMGSIVTLDALPELQKALCKAMSPDFYTRERMNKILEHARKFDWQNILGTLDSNIKQHLDE